MRNYEKYLSGEQIVVTSKEYYTDSGGFPNEKAFWDFVNNLSEEDKVYLLCLDVDLKPVSAKGTGYGDLILRSFFSKIYSAFPAFRMRGTKFNVLIPEDELELANKMLTTDNSEFFELHGEILKDKYVTPKTIKKLVREGVKRMVHSIADSKVNVDDSTTVEEKEDKPVELKETNTRKFIDEMWYATIEFKETSPNLRTLTAYVFPTAKRDPMALLHTIVVLDDKIKPRLFEGTNVHLPIDGMRISINARFSNDNRMEISWFKMDDDDDGNITGVIKIHEGSRIPANFGKRVSSTKEIYPIKMNNRGLFEYVMYDKGTDDPKKKVLYIDSGILRGKNAVYEVHCDSVAIDLVKVEQ